MKYIAEADVLYGTPPDQQKAYLDDLKEAKELEKLETVDGVHPLFKDYQFLIWKPIAGE